MFTPAKKKEGLLRLAITGISSSGKTYTSLAIATWLGGKIAVLDTENDSASLYANDFKFDSDVMEAPYHPQKYIDAIHEAERAGYGTLIIDSLTHVWKGEGGILSIVNGITASSRSGNSAIAWNDAGDPLYEKLIDAIIHSKINIIGTIRSKQKHVMELDEKTNKNKLTRVGVRPIQREDFEFEFDLVFDMGLDNKATVTKSRCKTLPVGMVIPKPGEATARMLTTWMRGAEWIEATSERAVSFAAEKWGIHKDEAKDKIEKAVKAEAVSAFLPKDEFKEWAVAVMA
jgi:hypothetical protein